MSGSRRSLHDFLVRYPFGVLLGTLLFLIAASPMISQLKVVVPGLHGQSAMAPLTILLTIVAAFTIWALSHSMRVVFAIAAVIVATVVIGAFAYRDQFVAVHFICVVLFLGYLLFLIVGVVFRKRVVDGNVLCGAVCIYLLLGVLIGYIDALLELAHPNSFFVPSSNIQLHNQILRDAPGLLIYFSLTTLTTAAFGDILPATDMARSVAMLEAVMGQITVVLIIGRLVGLHVVHATTAHHSEGTEREPKP